MKDAKTQATEAGSGSPLRECWTALRNWLMPGKQERSAPADEAHTTHRQDQSNEKNAKLYQRQDLLIVAASSKTTVGIWLESGPYFKLTTSASDEELGTAILSALQGSQSEVPHPTDWKNLQHPVYDLAGVRSWRAFVKGTSLVNIDYTLGRMTIVPCFNRGAKEGFEGDSQNAMSLDAPSALKVGESVRPVLARHQGNAPT